MAAGPALAQTSFVTFESGHVRPLARTPSGAKLLALNTPDNRLEVFVVSEGGLVRVSSIPVGMEPVAVAARNETEVWVVNHLSDSVSIVDLAASPPRVVRTLLVGDEPRDIVFAGTSGNRAFITTAHRGQHRTHASISGVTGSGDPQLKTEGIDRADVWVFDAGSLGATIGGTPVEIVSFFADTPRALAVSGNTVYAAAFHSGNQTTAVLETMVCDGFGSAGTCGRCVSTAGTTCVNDGDCPGGDTCNLISPGGVPDPNTSVAGAGAPETGLIVKWDGAAWRDAANKDWTSVVNLSLPDHDVFAINANTLAHGTVFDGVGTILFNMAVNPVSGKIYVTNTELPNHVRFEGPGTHGTVQGHLSETRITVLDPNAPSVIDPQHLNKHIDYTKLHTQVPDMVDATQIDHSLATPLQIVVSSDGLKLYMAAFGSAKVGVFDASDIEDPSFETNFDPTVESANYLATGGGPSGLVLDEARNRLYVLTRFDNSVSSIDLGTKLPLETHALHNPEPTSVVEGRPFLYDAVNTSGNGEASCSSCHIFADFDSLAWNLGDPDGGLSTNTQPPACPFCSPEASFHPMKGPMTTQTLRGMATHGAMHWRGDRVDGDPGGFGLDPCAELSGAPCDEDLSFRNFVVAFAGLVGMDGTPTGTDMQKFSDFALQIFLPPNPVRALDNGLSPSQQNGFDKFFSCGPGTTECGPPFDPNATDVIEDCDGCHSLDPSNGFFGTGGEQSFEGEPQNVKVAHMRNLYAKIGMFGITTNNTHLGDQVRGFGYLHDGAVDTVVNFLSSAVFSLNPTQVQEMTDFGHAFPTDLAPMVGQQVTLTADNSGAVDPRISEMVTSAATSFDSLLLGGTVTECDLIVKGTPGGVERGWVRESGGLFRDDLNNTISEAALHALASNAEPLTYTAVPPGSGLRMGIDRDEDLVLDGLDNCPGVDNPAPQADTDGDGVGDACDQCPGQDDTLNNDGDALPDCLDPCDYFALVDPTDGNADQIPDECQCGDTSQDVGSLSGLDSLAQLQCGASPGTCVQGPPVVALWDTDGNNALDGLDSLASLQRGASGDEYLNRCARRPGRCVLHACFVGPGGTDLCLSGPNIGNACTADSDCGTVSATQCQTTANCGAGESCKGQPDLGG